MTGQQQTMAKQKQGKENENHIPDEFVSSSATTADIDCPGCKCTGTVQKLLTNDAPKKPAEWT